MALSTPDLQGEIDDLVEQILAEDQRNAAVFNQSDVAAIDDLLEGFGASEEAPLNTEIINSFWRHKYNNGTIQPTDFLLDPQISNVLAGLSTVSFDGAGRISVSIGGDSPSTLRFELTTPSSSSARVPSQNIIRVFNSMMGNQFVPALRMKSMVEIARLAYGSGPNDTYEMSDLPPVSEIVQDNSPFNAESTVFPIHNDIPTPVLGRSMKRYLANAPHREYKHLNPLRDAFGEIVTEFDHPVIPSWVDPTRRKLKNLRPNEQHNPTARDAHRNVRHCAQVEWVPGYFRCRGTHKPSDHPVTIVNPPVV